MDGLALGTRKRKGVDDSDEALLTPKKARISHAMPSTGRTVPSTPATSIRNYVNNTSATPSRSRLSIAPSTPSTTSGLPPHLARLLNIYTALEQSMSFALATGQMAPDPDNGRVPAVLNHLGIAERGMGGTRMDVDDLRRLCWVWEWVRDAEHDPPSTQETESVLSQLTTRARVHSDTSVNSANEVEDEDDNPFIHKPTHLKGRAQEDDPLVGGSESETPKDWIRGGSGFIITPAMHVQKNAVSGIPKREPAYGIGIEVDWAQEDVAGGRVGGMGAVARWAAAGETRKRAFKEKLERWVEMHSSPASGLPTPAPSAIKSKIVGVKPLEAGSSIPVIPFADLPAALKPVKLATVTKLLVASLPKPLRAGYLPSATPSPVKTALSNNDNPSPLKEDAEGFMIPFPVAPGLRPVTPSGNHIPSTSFPRSGGIRTPSFGRAAAAAKAAAGTTPSSREDKTASSNGRVTPIMSLKRPIDLISKTPTHRRGNNSEPTFISGANSKTTPNTGAAEPETPTSARRRALYERIRTKSGSDGSDKKLVAVTASVRKPSSDPENLRYGSVTKLITPEELRRRCILGRLSSVAEAVWMLFASPANSSLTSAGRKRRAIEQDEVVRAVVKSANSPISNAEAVESLEMLCELCPFFLKRKVIDGEDWLEMPATTGAASMSPGAGMNASPGGSARPRYMDGLPSLMGSPGKVRVSEEEFLARSARRIKKEEGGLRQVRDIIRRELEVDGDDD